MRILNNEDPEKAKAPAEEVVEKNEEVEVSTSEVSINKEEN